MLNHRECGLGLIIHKAIRLTVAIIHKSSHPNAHGALSYPGSSTERCEIK